MDNTTQVAFDETFPGNMTNTTLGVFNDTHETMTNTTSEGAFDRLVETIYYEVNTIKNSQMVMGTMFLGMVLGMVIMVLCCVKHKSDGYYRVPPQKTNEEVELVEKRHLQDTRFEIGEEED